MMIYAKCKTSLIRVVYQKGKVKL